MEWLLIIILSLAAFNTLLFIVVYIFVNRIWEEVVDHRNRLNNIFRML